MNLLLTEESLQSQLSLIKLKEELLIEEDLESFLIKIFEPLTQNDSPFLHDVSKNEIFQLIHRVFSTQGIPKKEGNAKSKGRYIVFNTPEIDSWRDI